MSAVEGDRLTRVTRYEHPSGRVLDCVHVSLAAPERALLLDGIAELVAALQEILASARGPEHAGAAVVVEAGEAERAPVALAAVRGLVLSLAQELGPRLRVNLVVHDRGGEDLEQTLSLLASPEGAYVDAATIWITEPSP